MRESISNHNSDIVTQMEQQKERLVEIITSLNLPDKINAKLINLIYLHGASEEIVDIIGKYADEEKRLQMARESNLNNLIKNVEKIDQTSVK